MPRGKQIKPTKADERRWMRQLREQADNGDAKAIELLISLYGGQQSA